MTPTPRKHDPFGDEDAPPPPPQAASAPTETPIELPQGFSLNDEGVWLEPTGRRRGATWICSYLAATATTVDADNRNHGLLLNWNSRSTGERHNWAMPQDALASDRKGIIHQLMNRGLKVDASEDAQTALLRYLQMMDPPTLYRCVPTIGWQGIHTGNAAYVCGDENGTVLTTAKTPARYALQCARVTSAWKHAGTLETWREHIGKKCIGNSRLLFAVSCALAGPLLHLVGLESGGFHLQGNSSTGKTTAQRVAASVYGSALQSWHTTGNALEPTATAHNDSLLLLDEISLARSDQVIEMAYSLANETGKARMDINAQTRAPARWRLLFLSTGEISLVDHAAKAGIKAPAGAEVRIADIPAEAGLTGPDGRSLGAWENLHDAPDGAAFSKSLTEAAILHRGHLGRAWLDRMVANREKITADANLHMEAFSIEVLAGGAGGQVRRVAARFALVAAAGELAADLCGWPEGSATQAVATCFHAWVARRPGGNGANEHARAVDQIRGFLSHNTDGRFKRLSWGTDGKMIPGDDRQQVLNQTGWVRNVILPVSIEEDPNADGITTLCMEYLIHRAGWQEMCKGFDPKAVAKYLVETGHMMADAEGKSTKTMTVPGFPAQRLYVLRSTILNSSSE